MQSVAVLLLADAMTEPAKSGGGVGTDPAAFVWIQLAVAVVSAILLPVIFFILNRGKATADKLQEKVESNQADLRTAEIAQLKGDLAELKTLFRKYVDKLDELQRSYDRHPLECQNRFVTSEVFHREMAASKEYVKLLYGAIKQHLAKLESDLDSGDVNL